jgi:DNA (cytosine-5)-methyltransferase 1
MEIRYGSVCSGIEAASKAFEPLGWKPQWFSQYDPDNNYAKGQDFPSQVLNHQWPDIPNLGDMTELKNKKEYNESTIDLLVGGTPCQAFSIAGLRAGLADERSNLALEFVRILIDKRPEWFIWENVPGVLTSGSEEGSEGEGEGDDEADGDPSDFACLLSAWTGRDIAPQEFEKEGIIEAESEEHYSIAWRILDSRWFGVPQRRRRIFVVGHLGKDWRPPVAVLFEREGLRRDFTPSRKERKNATTSAEGSSGDSIGIQQQFRKLSISEYVEDENASTVARRDYKCYTDLIVKHREHKWWDGGDQSHTLTRRSHAQFMPDKSNFEAVISFTPSGFGDYKEGVGTLKKSGGDLGGGSETLIIGNENTHI